MGLFTLGTVLSEATGLIGNRIDLAQSRASLYANAALRFIWSTEYLDNQEGLAISSTTSGENKITLPPDFEHITNLSNISATPPYPLIQWNVDDIDSNHTYQGVPRFYVRYASWLELWPSPDSSYSMQLRYKTQPSTLTALTARGSLSSRHDMAWLYKTAELCADALKDWESATIMRAKFLSEMASVPNDLAMRQRARTGMRISMPHQERGELRVDSLTSII